MNYENVLCLHVCICMCKYLNKCVCKYVQSLRKFIFIILRVVIITTIIIFAGKVSTEHLLQNFYASSRSRFMCQCST